MRLFFCFYIVIIFFYFVIIYFVILQYCSLLENYKSLDVYKSEVIFCVIFPVKLLCILQNLCFTVAQ